MMKLRGNPEKWPKGYSTSCEKPLNKSVYDVRTRATNHVHRVDQWHKFYGDNLFWQNEQHNIGVVGYLWLYKAMAACRTALYLVDEFNSETVRTPVIVRTALHRMHTDPSRQKEPWALLASGCRQSLHAPTIVAIYRVNLCWSPSPSHSLDIWEHCPHCVSSVTQTYLYIIFVGTLHRSLVTNTSYTLSFCMLPSRDLLKRTSWNIT